MRQKYGEQRECQPSKKLIFLLAKDCYVSAIKLQTTWYTVIQDESFVHRKYDQLPQVLAETPKNAHDKVPKANVDHVGKRHRHECLQQHLELGRKYQTLFRIIWFSGCLDSWSSKRNFISFCIQIKNGRTLPRRMAHENIQ